MGEGEPLVCDFGITRISDEIDEDVTSKTMASGGNVGHGIPELVGTNGVSATKHSDTYSFVTLMLEFINRWGAVLPPPSQSLANSPERQHGGVSTPTRRT